jgi:hypothetical protein
MLEEVHQSYPPGKKVVLLKKSFDRVMKILQKYFSCFPLSHLFVRAELKTPRRKVTSKTAKK